MAKKKNKPVEKECPIEFLVESAMRDAGWVLPTTEEAVAKLEAELLVQPVNVPESLESSANVFNEITNSRVTRSGTRNESKNSTAANLSLAAREGGDIPAEIRERMNQDRETTEREYDQKHSDNEGV